MRTTNTNKMIRYNTDNGLQFSLKRVEKFNCLTFTYDNGVTIEVVSKPKSTFFVAHGTHKGKDIVSFFERSMSHDEFMSQLNCLAAEMANEE